MFSISQEQFESIAQESFLEIPKKFRNEMKNVAIVIQDFPTPKQLEKLKIRNNSLLLGLYEGVPQTKRWGRGQTFPDKITIFKNSIELLSNSEEDLKKLVKNTIEHEIAHHFGMNEEEVRRAKR